MNRMFKCSAFFVSYTPLWISILYMDIMSLFCHKTPNRWTEMISVSLIVFVYVISVLNMIRTFKNQNKENSEKLRITSVQEQKTAALEYVVTFVLPMFAFEFTQWEKCIPFVIYFMTLLILSIRHNLLFPNVVLALLKYRFYDVSVQNGNNQSINRTVISKQRLENMQEEDIYLRSMNNGLWFDVSNS